MICNRTKNLILLGIKNTEVNREVLTSRPLIVNDLITYDIANCKDLKCGDSLPEVSKNRKKSSWQFVYECY